MSASAPSPRTFSTPMMQQYASLKAQYADCLLLYRLGDFYELFLEDAHIGSRVLQIVLTRRPRGKDGDIPMAGVPYHAADRYIAKLVDAGYKVAICEQVSDPREKGIVKRDVVRIITPGTLLDEQSLKQKEHNYLMSLVLTPHELGVAVADLSTGSFELTQLEVTEESWPQILATELERFNPAEVLVSDALYNNSEFLFVLRSHGPQVTRVLEWDAYTHKAYDVLLKQFQVATLRGHGCEHDTYAQEAGAGLLGYLGHTQKGAVRHISTLSRYDPTASVVLDPSTVSNLELFHPLHAQKYDDTAGTLIQLLDETRSAMGGRMLREWLKRPLRSKKEIVNRLDRVEYCVQHPAFRERLRTIIESMYDVERIISRLSVRTGHVGDVVNLGKTLHAIDELKVMCMNEHSPLFHESAEGIDVHIHEVSSLIARQIIDNPPIDIRAGGFVADGVNSELDDLRQLLSGDTAWVTAYEQSEKERTGITTLRIRSNSVFGYYIEVSKSCRDRMPPEYIRTQTLVNAERYTTDELRVYEQKILTAQERIEKIEHEVFLALVEAILVHTSAIQQSAYTVANIDCLCSLAYRAQKSRYTRPDIHSGDELSIEHGRHPVVEERVKSHFVPNSVTFDAQSAGLHIITGPNMAGKSVFMRQTALITLMAHIGSFVPAQRAKISLVDRVCVRSGASDMITSGLSTFMVEMVETAYILNHATEKSLIILDEIGRGTSTYDGVSIAWAVAEYLVTHWKKAPKTLFATHYHELQDLQAQYPDRIYNAHMAVEDNQGKPIFLHRVVPGASSHSYGIAVAKLAGVPQEVITHAQERLAHLEEIHHHDNH